MVRVLKIFFENITNENMTELAELENFEPKIPPPLRIDPDNLRKYSYFMGPYPPECTGRFAEQEFLFCDTV